MENFNELLLQIRGIIIEMPRITPIDVIDITVVSFLIYKVMIWIKTTRAWTLFKGILIIFSMAIVSYFLQLNTVWWIFTNTISVGIMAIIVVFQPELRRALEKLGTSYSVVNMFSVENEESQHNALTIEVVDEIVDAAKQMSQKKTGALIVLEEKVKLGEYEETGIPIDSKVKSELLINIFEKNTPLHDGAVIIKNNRISSATCYLPLSTDDNISKKLGTRHRAAIGITEVSDCVVIIISEETGAISLVKDNEMTYDIKRENLRNQLINELKKVSFNPFRKFGLWRGKKKNEKKVD
ncbi:MAG: TIGR00159 family protein [Clostridiales bacterium GWE2_32_10]|nr:MAG: TIGR00159 family protein [Clostridiales bacterium GWE2_32_10]HBY20623.1 TIGR00159 family protein [Clostridiales bacterium]